MKLAKFAEQSPPTQQIERVARREAKSGGPRLRHAFVRGLRVESGLSDHDFLTRCWHAVQTAGDPVRYEMPFEAIVITATEGGIFSRSRACPEARLRFGDMPDDLSDRLFAIGESAPASTLGAGIRGRAIIVPLDRRSDSYLNVRVLELPALDRMTLRETRTFLHQHNIQ